MPILNTAEPRLYWTLRRYWFTSMTHYFQFQKYSNTFFFNWQLNNCDWRIANYDLQPKCFYIFTETSLSKHNGLGVTPLHFARVPPLTCCTDCTNRRSESSYSHKCFENKIRFTNLMQRVTRPIFFASYVT